MSVEYGFAGENADIAAMKALWREAFGDEEAVTEAFFASLYAPENTVLATENGELLGCCYLIPGVALSVPGEKTRSACYLYALSVGNARRGRGIGGRIMDFSLAETAKRGEILCLMPGSEGLREWYRSRCGMGELCGLKRETVRAGAAVHRVDLEAISPAEYLALREDMLQNTPHAVLPEAFFRYQAALCALSGGGFFRLRDENGNTGIVCAETDGEIARACELLFSGDRTSAASALAGILRKNVCRLCTPGDEPGLMARAGTRSVPGFRWGPVLD